MSNKYTEKIKEVYDQIGDHAKIVLATSNDTIVSARMMSFVINKEIFYFQTDKNFRKYRDIQLNKHVALCIDNIQIEGICEEVGHPLDNETFCLLFKKYFKSSFDSYSFLKDERLFTITPTFIQRWNYIDNKPLIESYDILNQNYNEREYYRE